MGYWGSRIGSTNNLLRFLILIVIGVGSIIMVMFWRSELFNTIDATASTTQLPVRKIAPRSNLKDRTETIKEELNNNQ